MPFVSPVDVQLDCDNKTIVQPDVLILCDKSKYTLARIVGAPDFVAEVLSKSTRQKDIFIKTNCQACLIRIQIQWIIRKIRIVQICLRTLFASICMVS